MYKSEAEDLFDQLPQIVAAEHVAPVCVTGSDSGYYVLASVSGGPPQVIVSIEQVYGIMGHLGAELIGATPPPAPAAPPPTIAELEAQLSAARAAAAPGETPPPADGVITPAAPESPQITTEPVPPTTDPVTGEPVEIPTTE